MDPQILLTRQILYLGALHLSVQYCSPLWAKLLISGLLGATAVKATMIAEGNFDEGRGGPAGAVRALRMSAARGVIPARGMGANDKRVGWAWLPG